MTSEATSPMDRLLRQHLPYELNMLEHTFRLLHSSDGYAKKLRENTVVANALIESFWTHARNLIEFFNQTKGDGLKGLASAHDMTEGYFADTKMRELDRMINVQISHLQYDRPALTEKQLNYSEMDRVRNIIAREVEKFNKSILSRYRDAWTPHKPIDMEISAEGWLKIASEQPTATNVVQTFLSTITRPMTPQGRSDNA
jgi:hypothetical protein